MDLKEEALEIHEKAKGKLSINSKFKVKERRYLSLLYTPGVAEPCKVIAQDKSAVYKYTGKGNLVAVVTDGSAVLGLGDIGPEASLPVMEGKALLFKEFGGVDAMPICIDSKEVEDIVKTTVLISPGFGGINLEDISAPRCFEIERQLKEKLDIPVFHDDQHGTAIVVHAALINALKVVCKQIQEVKIVINGGGAAGTAVTNQLINAGAKNIIVCDKNGALLDEPSFIATHHEELASRTNPNRESGPLSQIIMGADVFIGVSKGNLVSQEMVVAMNKDAIILAMANPTPEIMPDIAKAGGARVIATGRSDFPNQVNNLLAFPGIFKGVFKCKAPQITTEMKLAAANAIASMIPGEALNEENIIPSPLNKEVVDVVANAIEETYENSNC